MHLRTAFNHLFATLLGISLGSLVVWGIWWVGIKVHGIDKITVAPSAPATEEKKVAVVETKAPDVSKILALVGRDGMAHGCPIAPSVALTNRHVFFGDDKEPHPLAFSSDGSKAEGVLLPWDGFEYADLASGITTTDTPYLYLSTSAPVPGEQLWWVGYNWGDQQQFMATQIFTGHLLRIVAGNLVLDVTTPEGSSGSCILDARGQVVGIVAWKESTHSIGPAVYGERIFPLLPKIEEVAIVRSKIK